MMFDVRVHPSESALYLEVNDREELTAIQEEFDSFANQPPAHRATPEELGIQIDSGPEGSYSTALLRVRPKP
jgi:hypothetical protein